MTPTQIQRPNEVRYDFNRSACLGWTAFCFVLAAVGLLLAMFGRDELFVRGLIPGWLLGGFAAVLMTVFGISWAGRYRYEGPALELTEDGIIASPGLGGPATPRISGLLRWEAVSGVEAGKHGSIIIRLTNPNAFWTQQGRIDRILGWNPLRGDRLGLGGNDIAHESSDVIANIAGWIKWHRLAPREQARGVSGGRDADTAKGHNATTD